MTPYLSTLVVLLCALTVAAVDLPDPLSDDFINLINSEQNLWKAGRNFPINTPLKYIKGLMGLLQNEHNHTFPIKADDDNEDTDLITSLPENFDARDHWPNCPSIKEIRDQGSCGSCWAFGAVETMTDRFCIYSNGTQHFHFSAEDLLTCCRSCGSCEGGFPLQAWIYWYYTGIVSGGNYNSSQGCMPYKIPPCDHENIGSDACELHRAETPKCMKTCDSNYNVSYEKDKRKGLDIYCIVHSESIAKKYLYLHGPLEAGFEVYSDFIHYKTGVYKHTKGQFLGLHAVKIIGWGVENGTKYWLIANSWNTRWGDKGFFKILRGENHCDIENLMIGGKPQL